MDYAAPSGSTDANAPFVGKTASTQGSKVPPRAVEYPQREIVHAIKAAGLVPSNNDLTQLIQVASRGLWLGTFGGTADALTATMPSSADGIDPVIIPALKVGSRVRGIAAAANATTTPKLTLIGLGSANNAVQFPIVAQDGSALSINAWKLGQFVSFDIDAAGNARFSGGGVASGLGAGVLVDFQYWDTATTFTPNPAASAYLTFLTGGGSGGAGAYGGSAGAGGGAGGTIIALLAAPSAMAFTPGLGGSGGVGSSSGATVNSTAGSPTTLGSILTANGGGPTQNAGGFLGGVGGLGGLGTIANGILGKVFPGGTGMVASGLTGSGTPGAAVSGGGSFWAGGGAGSFIGAYSTNPSGQDGQAPGTGGGGGSASANGSYAANGGNGAKGCGLFLGFR